MGLDKQSEVVADIARTVQPALIVAGEETVTSVEQPIDDNKPTNENGTKEPAKGAGEASPEDHINVNDEVEEEPVVQDNDSLIQQVKDQESERASQVGAFAAQPGAALDQEKTKVEAEKADNAPKDEYQQEHSSIVMEQKQKDAEDVVAGKPNKTDETMETSGSLGSSSGDSVAPTVLVPSAAGRSTVPGAQSIQGIGGSSDEDDDGSSSFFRDTEAGHTTNNEDDNDDMIQAELVKDVTAEAEILEEEDPAYLALKRRRRRIFFGVGLCLVIVSIVVAVSVSVAGSGGSTSTKTQFVAAPTGAPTFAPTSTPSASPSNAPTRLVWDVQSVGPLEGEATEIVFSNFGDNVVVHDIADFQETLKTNATTMIVATYGGSAPNFGRRARRRNLRRGTKNPQSDEGKALTNDERRDFAFSDAKRLAYFFCKEGSCKEGLSIRQGLFGPIGSWKIDVSNDGRKMIAATDLWTHYYDFGRENKSIAEPDRYYFGDPLYVLSAIEARKVAMNGPGTFMAAIPRGALFVYELVDDFGYFASNSGSGGGLVPPPPVGPFAIPPDDLGGNTGGGGFEEPQPEFTLPTFTEESPQPPELITGPTFVPPFIPICNCDPVFGCSETDPLPIDPTGEGGIIIKPPLGCGFPVDQPISMAWVPPFVAPEEYAEAVAIQDVTVAFGLQNRSNLYFSTIHYWGFSIHVYSVYGDKIGQTLDFEEGWSMASQDGIELAKNGTILAFSGIQNSTAGTEEGTVFVYELVGDDWFPRGSPLKGSPGEGFGAAITMNADGTVLAIGAPRAMDAAATERGQVFTFSWSDNDWVAIDDGNLLGFEDSSFGIALSMTQSGETMVVGLPDSDRRGDASGDVHIFNFVGV